MNRDPRERALRAVQTACPCSRGGVRLNSHVESALFARRSDVTGRPFSELA